MDFNPIKVNTLVTTGQDSCIRFWDLRKIETGKCALSYDCTASMRPDKEFAEQKISLTGSNRNSTNTEFQVPSGQQHQSHWVKKIRFNMSHDQLLLTCDTCSFLNLYRFSSVSSAPSLSLNQE